MTTSHNYMAKTHSIVNCFLIKVTMCSNEALPVCRQETSFIIKATMCTMEPLPVSGQTETSRIKINQ